MYLKSPAAFGEFVNIRGKLMSEPRLMIDSREQISSTHLFQSGSVLDRFYTRFCAKMDFQSEREASLICEKAPR